MRATLLDLSQRSELSLHGSIVADVGAAARALGIETLIVGAFARDIQLLYRYGIDTQRRTEDVDIALAVPDWVTFEALKVRMIQSAAFRPLAHLCRSTAASQRSTDRPGALWTYRDQAPKDCLAATWRSGNGCFRVP
jgi:predicted nucleotidyltransferase